MKEADRLQSLMDRLLTPHRLPQAAPLNVHEVLERVRSLILAEFPRGIAIERDYDVSLPLVNGRQGAADPGGAQRRAQRRAGDHGGQAPRRTAARSGCARASCAR